MKILINIFCFFAFAISFITYSQDYKLNYYYYGQSGESYTPVIYFADTNKPLTPYGNGWMKFNGVSQFMRSYDSPYTEFIYGATDSFIVGGRWSIGLPRKDQYITGHSNGLDAGWLFTFGGTPGADRTAFWLAGTYYVIDTLAATDSTFHDYKVIYRKAAQTLECYVDGVLNKTYTSVTYSSPNIVQAFAIGHGVALASISDPTTGNCSPSTAYMKGKMDSVYSIKWPGGTDSAVSIGFNDGAGEWARDYYTYTYADRTSPDIGNSSQGHHACNGWNPGPDSQNAAWSRGVRKCLTNTYEISGGVQSWFAGGFFGQGFVNGTSKWKTGLVVTAALNRVNATFPPWTHSGDTAAYIAYWDGSTWSKIGPNGSFFTGTITQAFGDGDTLYAGGEFSNAGGLANADNIAVFKGTAWDTLAKGLDAHVYCFNKIDGKIYVGGAFNNSGSTPITSSVARWDWGTWTAIGTSNIGEVWAIEEHRDSIFAATNTGLWKYNGTDWVNLSNMGGATMFCLASYNDNQLWYGGTGGTLGYWSGTAAVPMGTTSGFANHIIEFAQYGNDLYVIGSLYRIVYNGRNTVVDKLARWNGREWSAVVYNVTMRPEDGFIQDYEDSVVFYYTGDQDAVDGIPGNYVFGINLTNGYTDNTSPVVNHTSLTDTAEFNFPLTVNYTAYKVNETGIASGNIAWKVGVNGAVTNAACTDLLSTNWSGSIAPDTSETVAGDTVFYTITATDWNGRSTSTSQYSFIIQANPLDYRTNLAVLWIADSNVTTSGGKITTWQNMVDTLTARQSTDADRPTLVSDFLNGYDCALFSNKLLTFTSTNYATYTVVIVYKATTFTAGDADVMLGGTAGDVFSAIRVLPGGFGVGNGSAFRYEAYTAADTNWGIRVFQAAHLWRNGVEVSYAGTPGSPSSITISGIGRRPPTSYPYDGYIAEIRIYTEILSTANRQLVQTYLNNKYQIY